MTGDFPRKPASTSSLEDVNSMSRQEIPRRTSVQTIRESTLLESVDKMFDGAAAFCPMEEGLKERIKACNLTFTVRFGAPARPCT